MRVDESWRPNASESCNSHQLSSSFDLTLTQKNQAEASDELKNNTTQNGQFALQAKF